MGRGGGGYQGEEGKAEGAELTPPHDCCPHCVTSTHGTEERLTYGTTLFLVLSTRQELLNLITGQSGIHVQGTYPRLRPGLADTVQTTMAPVCSVPARGDRR